MDEIDRKQQDEIDSLKSLTSQIIVAFVIISVIQFSSMILLFWQMTNECPHKECPHHAQVR